MKSEFTLVRGMRDLLPASASRMSYIEDTFKATLTSYGYAEIRLPLMERSELFARGVGESTDAVSKEMYTLLDRDEQLLALRPEGTASCVRAVLANDLLRGDRPRLWYSGSMFRYERPQKGRYREFQQVGAEVFGEKGPAIDIELIQMGQDVWRTLGLEESTSLQINTLGTPASRKNYRTALIDYLEPLSDKLDEDSQRRLHSNPLRILDSKSDSTQRLLEDAPVLSHYMDEESQSYFAELRRLLDRYGIEYEVNERLVRGLDYYSHLVFEWHNDRLGAQSQIGGGGRYDGLVELLGGPACPASGFAVGIDRIALAHEQVAEVFPAPTTDVYVIALSKACLDFAIIVGNHIRQNTTLRVRQHHGNDRAKVQFKAADRSGARWGIIIGEEEAAMKRVAVKPLREDNPQSECSLDELIEYFKQMEN